MVTWRGQVRYTLSKKLLCRNKNINDHGKKFHATFCLISRDLKDVEQWVNDIVKHVDLIIIGGGAAGLMAGALAGEAGISTLILERKVQPARKLLMCGNSRCNLTCNISIDRMLAMYAKPVGEFLAPALRSFSPSDLQRWFKAKGLPTVVKTGNRVYPQSERATDVLSFFMDRLREYGVSIALLSPVNAIERLKNDGFEVEADNFSVCAKHVLVATGGVSYPKTGSVGDGQEFARRLGHSLEPFKPGLAGFEMPSEWMKKQKDWPLRNVKLRIMADGKCHGETYGDCELEKWGIGGAAIVSACNIVSRYNLENFQFEITPREGRTISVKPLAPRPLKEAMVTVGGVRLLEVDPKTMESRLCSNLFFAGEVLDVDGPSGGYNLHAAFATARFAVGAIARKLGKEVPTIPQNEPKNSKKPRKWRRT